MNRREQLGHSLRVARRFTPDLAPEKRGFLVIGMTSLLVVLADVLRPWPIKWVIDGVLLADDEPMEARRRWLLIAAITLCAIACTKAVFQYLSEIWTARVGHAVTRRIRFRLFEHASWLSPRFHQDNRSGDLLMRLMGDVPMARAMLVDSTVMLVTRSLMIVGILGVMVALDPLLTLVLAVVGPVFFFTVRGLSKSITIAVRKQRRKEGALADFMHEAIVATPTIQSLGRTEHTLKRFARGNRTSVRAGLKAARLAARLGGTVEALLGLTMAVALALGGWRVLEGVLEPGDMIVFLSYVRSLLKPVRSSSKHAERIARGTACGERILAVLDHEIEVESRPGAGPAPLAPHTLKFDNVEFQYADGSSALRRFSASFRRGESTVLFGPSGAGKSTFAALAVRLRDPSAGSISLDGMDIRDLNLSSLRERFGLCMQDCALFGETIRENLLLGRPDATDADLAEALHAAAADGFVDGLPEGLDTQLGAMGSGLSGGERQRLALARTFLRRTPIVLLDEPFSGLDRHTADLVRERLAEWGPDRILILITHDHSCLAYFDRVLEIAEGSIVGERKVEEAPCGSATGSGQ